MNSVPSVKFKMLIAHLLSLFVRQRNSWIYPVSTVAFKCARFELSRSQRVGILQEKIYKVRITDLDELKSE